jgi:hypothetical protein
MKRFLLRFLLLAGLTALLLMCLSLVYLQFLNTDYERAQESTLQYKYMPESIDIGCFGSSHVGNGFQTLVYHGEGTMFNFNLPFQIPTMDAALYDYSKDRFSDHAIIVIDLSCFSLYYDSTSNMDNMKRYVTFLPVRDLPGVPAKLFKLFRVIDFSFEPIFATLQGKTVEPGTAQRTTTTTSRFSEEKLREMGISRAETFLSYVPSQSVSKRTDQALRGMLEDCLKRGYRPVLVTTPYLSVLNDAFSDEFLTQFHADCQVYADDYGIPYLDYSQDARFTHATDYFVDTDHLSTDGSEAFMQIFFEDLKAYYPEN